MEVLYVSSSLSRTRFHGSVPQRRGSDACPREFRGGSRRRWGGSFRGRDGVRNSSSPAPWFCRRSHSRHPLGLPSIVPEVRLPQRFCAVDFSSGWSSGEAHPSSCRACKPTVDSRCAGRRHSPRVCQLSKLLKKK